MYVCEAQPTPASSKTKIRPSILCVDDSPEIREICRTILEADGYQVFTASNGPEALELLKSHSMDAAVIDYVIPGMNGADLAREIKGSVDDVFVVMYSGTLRGNESFPFVDSCLPKEKGPIALRKLLGSLLRA